MNIQSRAYDHKTRSWSGYWSVVTTKRRSSHPVVEGQFNNYHVITSTLICLSYTNDIITAAPITRMSSTYHPSFSISKDIITAFMRATLSRISLQLFWEQGCQHFLFWFYRYDLISLVLLQVLDGKTKQKKICDEIQGYSSRTEGKLVLSIIYNLCALN